LGGDTISMIDYIKTLVTTASPSDSFDMVIRRMAKDSRNVTYPGIVVILDNKGILLGVLTDGDIRRAYAANIPFSSEISRVMVQDPITISDQLGEEFISSEVIKKVQFDERHHSEWIRHILVVDKANRLINVIDYLYILQNRNGPVNRVAVVGLGYVGLTLAVSLANRGHQVTGIDIQESIISSLNNGNSHIFESGLDDMLKANLERQSIEFSRTFESEAHQVYIVAVGTPLGENSKPDLALLKNALEAISKNLKKGNQVMLRSTVPVGVTRGVVIPYLEEMTGLIAGVDFHLSFAPERTIEGAAMYELKTLPQVVGGYSAKCTQLSVDFWSTLTPTVVRVDSIEAAEMVKLANNTFRDLSFSFSNELALLADKYNVNAFELINAANEGYPRNKIPSPSPGVGGYCLTKDPILFSSDSKGLRADAVLGVSSRKVNERAALYPIQLIHKYVESSKFSLSELNVLIIGISFKGVPETKDVRSSVSIDLLNKLKGKVKNVYGWDAVIKSKALNELGFKVSETLEKAIGNANVVLIMNNHPDNICSDIYIPSKNLKLIFDGWNQLNKMEVEKAVGLIYSTMGYMTPND
jgi:UDP-N-acetyl-D-mannosaminuronic acid dehydrogenase